MEVTKDIVNKVKNLFGLWKNDDPDAKIFNSNKAINAKKAYMVSRYEHAISQKDLLQRFFASTNEQIAIKCAQKTFCCMVEIDDDIKEFIPNIVEHFQDKLGYKIIVIDNDTEILDKTTKKPVKVSPNSTFLILMWNTADISETVFTNKDPYYTELEEKK